MNPAIHEHVAMTCAQTWAGAHAERAYDGRQFGVDVMNVYLAAEAAFARQGDAKAMAAALTALSVPAEVLQALERFVALYQRLPDIPASAADVSGQGQ